MSALDLTDDNFKDKVPVLYLGTGSYLPFRYRTVPVPGRYSSPVLVPSKFFLYYFENQNGQVGRYSNQIMHGR